MRCARWAFACLTAAWLGLLIGSPVTAAAGSGVARLDGEQEVALEVSSPGEEPTGTAGAAAELPPDAPDPAELFIDANRLYEEGDYPRAIELYAALRVRGLDGAALHYNLANAYLRNGELGRAVAAYRRSVARAPRDEDARANLAFARRSTKDAIAPPEPSPAMTTLFFWHYGLSRGERAWALLAVNLLFWSVAAVRLFHRRSEVLRWLFVALLVVGLALAGSLAAHLFFPVRVAVVIPQEVEARTAPDAEAVVRFKLHAGTEVRLEDRRDGWLRIALPDGQQGWIDGRWAEIVEDSRPGEVPRVQVDPDAR